MRKANGKKTPKQFTQREKKKRISDVEKSWVAIKKCETEKKWATKKTEMQIGMQKLKVKYKKKEIKKNQ